VNPRTVRLTVLSQCLAVAVAVGIEIGIGIGIRIVKEREIA
jgi:hypothetical protein